MTKEEENNRHIRFVAFEWLRTKAATGNADALHLLHEIVRLRDVERNYNELIFAVASKFPDESRHATALRYIKEAEVPKYYMPACDPNAYKEINVGVPPGTLDKIVGP